MRNIDVYFIRFQSLKQWGKLQSRQNVDVGQNVRISGAVQLTFPGSMHSRPVGLLLRFSLSCRPAGWGLGQGPRVLHLVLESTYFLYYVGELETILHMRGRIYCTKRVKYECAKRKAGTHLVLCKALTQNTLPNETSHAPYSIRKSNLAATYRTNEFRPDGLPTCCMPAFQLRTPQAMGPWQLFTQGGSGAGIRHFIESGASQPFFLPQMQTHMLGSAA